MPMNTANKLTLARVFMIPLFLVIAYWGFPGSRYVALGVYILACLTDLLDGYVARHYNQVEKGRVIAAGWSGKVKTASTMVCICLMLFGIPHWLNLVCQGVILVTTVYSGVEYFAKNWDVFQEKK